MLEIWLQGMEMRRLTWTTINIFCVLARISYYVNKKLFFYDL